jgi:hypothetical protein
MRSIIFIALFTGLAGCAGNGAEKDTKRDTATTNKRLELAEPDKDLREQYEALQKLKDSGCVFADPDTAAAGIKLRDPESAQAIIGDKNKKDDNDEYHFYAAKRSEILTLTQHAGDGENAISIFKIASADKADYGYRKLKIDTFQTGKGIRRGLTRQQLVDKLGPCYITKDSTQQQIELYYQLAQPQDSKTRLLERHNMPVYYASYKFVNNKLEQIEFGFEYP